MRVLIAVTHLLGAGHLTRAAALARAFAAAGHRAVLVSGGTPAPTVRLDGVRLVQLPPLRSDGADFSRLLGPDGLAADAALFDRRRAMLVAALDAAAPDAVLTELFPFGRRALAGEFLALVAAARARRPRPLVLASVRDILVAPDKPGKVAQAHARAAALYDAVLVHGDPALVPLDASWPLDAAARAALRYTGYVDEAAAAAPPGRRAGVLVAAGSSAAGLGLFRAAAEAARCRPGLGWRLLVGHGVSEADLRAVGRGLPEGTVARARPDYRALLAGAALSVSQCGYNTAVDLVATGTPAVLVPFEAGRETEQRLRAERLAARGLARLLPEAELTPGALLSAVEAGLADPRIPPGGPTPRGIDLGGAARTVAIVETMAGKGRPAPPGSVDRPARPRGEPDAGDGVAAARGFRASLGRDFADLERALDRAATTGRRVQVWWRDDDAVAATPALDRLLGLAADHGAPILLAAIPARAEPSLARRLDGAPGVRVAVHGLAHDDHAPAGEKPAEFGPHRPLDRLVADAAAALRVARDRLPPAGLLPVFVPPWNRLSADLAAALPALGYRGLSAVPGPAIPGLARADATLDPIDWRGTRSLREPGGLLRTLAADIARHPGRPVGLLTHHRVHDPAVWAFLAALLEALAAHPAVDLADPRALFADAAMDSGAARSSFVPPGCARTG